MNTDASADVESEMNLCMLVAGFTNTSLVLTEILEAKSAEEIPYPCVW